MKSYNDNNIYIKYIRYIMMFDVCDVLLLLHIVNNSKAYLLAKLVDTGRTSCQTSLLTIMHNIISYFRKEKPMPAKFILFGKSYGLGYHREE